MYMYAQIENGKVIGVSELAGEVKQENLVLINEIDTRLLGCYYVNGKFEGFYTQLKYENSKVIAEVWTYLEEPATDYNGEISFEYDGQTVTVQAVNGEASIDFIADTNTSHTVKTVNEKMRNGEVTFFA